MKDFTCWWVDFPLQFKKKKDGKTVLGETNASARTGFTQTPLLCSCQSCTDNVICSRDIAEVKSFCNFVFLPLLMSKHCRGFKEVLLKRNHFAVMDFAVDLWLIGTRLSEHLLVSKHMAIRLCRCHRTVTGGGHYYLSYRVGPKNPLQKHLLGEKLID